MDSVTNLIERAKTATGLGNLGSDSYQEGLERLVLSADRDARLNAAGVTTFEATVVDFLSRRLEIEHWYERHPEIDEQEIVAPLIGLGLPRTGSTAFQCLLAEDDGARFIRTWEAHAPCPPPETATEHSDPRIAADAERLKIVDQIFPRLKTMLPLSPTAPMECQYFMGYDFKSMLFSSSLQVVDYNRWLTHEANLVPTFQYLKRILKLLQWRCPPYSWRLKNPSLSVWIDDLDAVFPDARYWMTHRDIAKIMPSIVDMYYEFVAAGSDDVDIRYLDELNQDMWEVGLKRLIAFRGRDDNEARFFDAQFEEVQKEPIPVFERLYAFLGETLTDETRQRMLAWRDDTPRDKHGVRQMRTDLDIDLEKLGQRFRFYAERYGVRA